MQMKRMYCPFAILYCSSSYINNMHHSLCQMCKYCLMLQLFKRRNVATVEDDSVPEDDGMADSGYLESQANNMDPVVVRREQTSN